jgi:hypothetical protein
MRNSNIGCLSIIALVVVIGFVWQAVLYIGMPVGLICGLGAFFAYRKASADGQGNTDYKFKLFIGGAASIALFVASAAGNFFSDDGLFTRAKSGAVASPEDNYGQIDMSDPHDRAIGAVVHHCDQGWRQEYLSYEDCVQGKTMRERMLEADK